MNKRFKQAYGKHLKKKQLWDMHTYLSRIILNNLRAFRALELHSVPHIPKEDESSIAPPLEVHHVTNSQDDPMIVKWKALIDKMIWSFNEIANDYPNDPQTLLFNDFDKYEIKYKESDPDKFYTKYPDGECPRASKEELDKYSDRINEGLNLFAKYLKDLWD